jgi:hypothetical protein
MPIQVAGPADLQEPSRKKSRVSASACKTALPTEPGVIVICAQRPEGYRLDPDLLRARKVARDNNGPPRRESMKDGGCQTVGPAGCMNKAGINILAAAAVAAKMARTALSGGNVGKLFITNPQPSEYDIYVALKADRAEAEAIAAASAENERDSADDGAAQTDGH